MLGALVRTEIARHTLMLCPNPQTCIEAAVDQGQIASVRGNSSEPVCEIELELKTGDVTALYDVALDLLAVAPVRLERRSKSARGFRLAALSAEPERIAAVHASEVALDPAMTAAAALRRITRSCVDQIVGNEATVLAGMPEGIHQMRVGVRRLRAILSTFAPLLNHDEFSRFSDELRWLGDVLGRARNLDVFVDGLVAPAIKSISDVPGITALNAAFAERRAAAHTDAAEAIVSPRYTALMLSLMRWSEESGATDQSAAALSCPLAKVAPRLLKRRLKLVRRRSAGFSKQSSEHRHRLRIALKKLRYAIEMLGHLYVPEKTTCCVVKRIQGNSATRTTCAYRMISWPNLRARQTRGSLRLARSTDWHTRRLRRRKRKVEKHVAKIRVKILRLPRFTCATRSAL